MAMVGIQNTCYLRLRWRISERVHRYIFCLNNVRAGQFVNYIKSLCAYNKSIQIWTLKKVFRLLYLVIALFAEYLLILNKSYGTKLMSVVTLHVAWLGDIRSGDECILDNQNILIVLPEPCSFFTYNSLTSIPLAT